MDNEFLRRGHIFRVVFLPDLIEFLIYNDYQLSQNRLISQNYICHNNWLPVVITIHIINVTDLLYISLLLHIIFESICYCIWHTSNLIIEKTQGGKYKKNAG